MELNCGTCKIRSWRPEDAQPLVCHADNVNVWRNLRDRFPHPYTREEAQWWLTHAVSSEPETDFAIVFGGEAVGGIGFTLGLTWNDIRPKSVTGLAKRCGQGDCNGCPACRDTVGHLDVWPPEGICRSVQR